MQKKYIGTDTGRFKTQQLTFKVLMKFAISYTMGSKYDLAVEDVKFEHEIGFCISIANFQNRYRKMVKRRLFRFLKF